MAERAVPGHDHEHQSNHANLGGVCEPHVVGVGDEAAAEELDQERDLVLWVREDLLEAAD